MSGIRKLILILTLIIFQTFALTIGGMTARALFPSEAAKPADIKHAGYVESTGDITEVINQMDVLIIPEKEAEKLETETVKKTALPVELGP